MQDLRYALRTVMRQPGFSAVAIFTLAIGIGANTAIYSVVDATLLRPLPFHDPDRLMKVSLVMPPMFGRPSNDTMIWSYPKYQAFCSMQDVFEETALYGLWQGTVTGTGEPERVRGEQVTASYFPALGIRAAVGRTFLPEEDSLPERDMVAIISYGLWQRRFAGDRAAIGSTIELDFQKYTIVGVLPAAFRGLRGPGDVWLPIHTLSGRILNESQSHSWELVARLKPGVSAVRAESVVTQLGAAVDRAIPDPRRSGWGAKARTLEETRLEPTLRKAVLVLYGAVTFVLLIACANIANLLLARGAARRREIAVRLALGAGRRRLVRQFLTESATLAILGAVASLPVAWAGVRALAAANPGATGPQTFGRLPGLTLLGLGSIQMNWRVLLFTLAATVVTGVLFGLLPAIEGARSEIAGTLKNSDVRVSGGTARRLLVVSEIALAMVLLTGAALMLKSFARLIATGIGIDPERLLTVRLEPPQRPGGDSNAFFVEMERRAASLPGVISTGLNNCAPVSGGCNGTLIGFPDRGAVAPSAQPSIGIVWASPTYLKTMKLPLLKGRWFTPADRVGSPKVMVVNEAAARTFWPGEDPVGHRATAGQGGYGGDGAEVIGVVADVRYLQADEPVRPDVYVPYLQSPRSNMLLYIRTAGDPAALIGEVRREVRALNRDLPLFDIQTMDTRISGATSKPRFTAILLAVFAGIALCLAAIGIYGVMSYLVTQRTREIGIRMALGARRKDVLSLVIRRGTILAAFGIGIGTAGALAATRALTTLLYEVQPGDPATYVEIGAILAVVALAACYLPAHRASIIDPSLALRAE
ncbi:MAG TPA: ABC transporter permease [Bryobacteraceae bacterium]|nr:ABC transporter permease [Bryobacteraceae bacterium]